MCWQEFSRDDCGGSSASEDVEEEDDEEDDEDDLDYDSSDCASVASGQDTCETDDDDAPSTGQTGGRGTGQTDSTTHPPPNPFAVTNEALFDWRQQTLEERQATVVTLVNRVFTVVDDGTRKGFSLKMYSLEQVWDGGQLLCR